MTTEVSNTGGVPARTKRALLIGINNYPNFPYNQLVGCVSDIVEFRKLLLSQGHFPETQVHALLAPTAGKALPKHLRTADEPTTDKIRAAFESLVQASQMGDDVVIYYSGHGVRVENPTNPLIRVYGFAPKNTTTSGHTFDQLILSHDLRGWFSQLVERGVTLTVILDCCHSGGGTRGLLQGRIRELKLNPSPEQWTAFQQIQHLDQVNLHPPTGRGRATSGWLQGLDRWNSWICLAACEEDHEAQEVENRGALSLALQTALQASNSDDSAGLRWADVFRSVGQNIQLLTSGQTPVLEGDPSRPIFGGTWVPFDPGLLVTASPDAATVTLNGGAIQGLDSGAQVGIYPPETADFAAADAALTRVDADIIRAGPISSQARLRVTTAAVKEGWRARLIVPSPNVKPLGVVLTDVPDTIAAAITTSSEVNAAVAINSAARQDVEVLPWKGPEGGWVLVRFSQRPIEPKDVTVDDVIAYLPAPERVAGNTALLGTALGKGLLHWAHFANVLNRTNTNDTLKGYNIFQVALLGGTDPNLLQPLTPDNNNIYQVSDQTWVMPQVTIGNTRYGLFVGALVGWDGHLERVWPPQTQGGVIVLDSAILPDKWLQHGEVKQIGKDDGGPGQLGVRDDSDPPSSLYQFDFQQRASLYTYKFFAFTESANRETVDLGSMAQRHTVQEVIDDELDEGTRDMSRGQGIQMGSRELGWTSRSVPPVALWTTQNVTIRVTRT